MGVDHRSPHVGVAEDPPHPHPLPRWGGILSQKHEGQALQTEHLPLR